MTVKEWLEYLGDEKDIFGMNNTFPKISHFWILLRLTNTGTRRKLYKVLPNSFVILIPGMIRLKFPNINMHQHDVATQTACTRTLLIEDVLTKELNELKKSPIQYDSLQMQTPLVLKILGKKYDGLKTPREKDMLIDVSILHKETRVKLQECHSYVVRTELDDPTLTAFDEVFSNLANNSEASPNILEILKNASTLTKKFHLLGFLSNANAWLRYGYNFISGGSVAKDAKPRWMPLSYKYSKTNNKQGRPCLTDISNTIAESVCESLTGHSTFALCPKYHAIGMKTGGGYRIIDRQIFDIFTYNGTGDEDILTSKDYSNEFRARRQQQKY